jgi:hypothetical protein
MLPLSRDIACEPGESHFIWSSGCQDGTLAGIGRLKEL